MNCQQHNSVISKCIYTACEQAAIGVIALTPNYSIVSYGSAICDLCPFSQVHKKNTRQGLAVCIRVHVYL